MTNVLMSSWYFLQMEWVHIQPVTGSPGHISRSRFQGPWITFRLQSCPSCIRNGTGESQPPSLHGLNVYLLSSQIMQRLILPWLISNLIYLLEIFRIHWKQIISRRNRCVHFMIIEPMTTESDIPGNLFQDLAIILHVFYLLFIVSRYQIPSYYNISIL